MSSTEILPSRALIMLKFELKKILMRPKFIITKTIRNNQFYKMRQFNCLPFESKLSPSKKSSLFSFWIEDLLFSSPEQHSRRAIVLGAALAAALASAPKMLNFSLKFLRPHYFLTLPLIWFKLVQNFAQYHPQPPRSCQGQGHRLRIFMLNFYVKVFRLSLLLNWMIDLVPIWYHDRYWSKVFISTTSTHDRDLKVEFKC